jgi:23S rRNA pseudouridine1911/1915/1917 synthase
MKNFKETILFEDNNLLIVNKSPGIPSIPDQSKDVSALQMANEYFKKDLYPINRLDRPVSGILLFGKKKKVAAKLSGQFKTRTVQKEYLGFVSGLVEDQEGSLVDYLVKVGANKKVYIDNQENTATRKAITNYKLLGASDNYSLLHIIPETGRFHQIRVQLANLGMHIKGDVKYGARRANKDRSIHLHAWKLNFTHPKTKQKMLIEASTPKEALWDFGNSLI